MAREQLGPAPAREENDAPQTLAIGALKSIHGLPTHPATHQSKRAPPDM
jgi:hypothetical protein